MNFTGKTIDYHNGPIIVPCPEEDGLWALLEDYIITIGTSIRIECPKDMHTDGTSAPWWIWWLIGPPMELPQMKASVAHDGCYTGELVWYVKDAYGEWVIKNYNREDADKLHRELMANQGISWWKRNAMYRALRVFSGKYWTNR